MGRIARALAGLVAAAVLMVGIPIALVKMAGWPLPRQVPDWNKLYWDIRQGNIGATVVVKTLACVVWLGWAQLAWALLWELFVNLPRLGKGHPEVAAPLAPTPMSRFARRLVTAVMTFTTVASTPSITAAAPSLADLAAAAAPPFDLGRAPTTLVHHASDTTRPTASTAATWVAVNGDTLWDIAERCLGDGGRVDELIACNPTVQASRPLRGGQVVVLPAGATAPADRSPAPTATEGGTTLGNPSAHSESVDGDVTYTVERGDTLWRIIDGYYGHVDDHMVDTVAELNAIPDADVIHPGQQVALPHPSVFDNTPIPQPGDPAPTDPPAPAPEPEPADTAPAPAVTQPPTTGTPTEPEVAAPHTTTPPATARPVTTPVTHDTTDERITPPATVPPVTAASDVDAHDVLNARWMFGAAAVTSLALGGAWVTLHQLRRRRRRWLGITPPAPVSAPDPTDREERVRHDLTALGDLVDPSLAIGSTVRGVILGDDPELRVRADAPAPPTGWDARAGVWWRSDPDAATPRLMSPALVTIGECPDVGDIVLDLATAGTVSVTGDRVAVERLVCSMLWELAACPLGTPVDLYVVGLTCAAEQHTANRASLVTLEEAVALAAPPHADGEPVRVFLVDPFAAPDDTPTALGDLVAACPAGSGKAVVIAGPCEQPSEEVHVPTAQRCVWDGIVLDPPQLDERADAELSQMFAAVSVGRRPAPAAGALPVVPDAEAEAVALRLTATMLADADAEPTPGGGHDVDRPAEPALPAIAVEGAGRGDAVDLPEVILTVCGRTVGVLGHPVPQLTAVVFVLAAAGRPIHTAELTELTGYAAKSVSSVFTTTHPLVERENGTLRLRDHVWTDHRWTTECVRQLAAAMQDTPESPDAARWMRAAVEAVRMIEQGPYAVLPTVRDRPRSTASTWGWVDEFPGDVPARTEAETEVAEAALALSELWLSAPNLHALVRPSELTDELCRLASLIPYAHVVKQVRQSPWVSGAECLLAAAAEVAGDDDRALAQVQRVARAMAAREQLAASSDFADALGL